MKAAVLEVVFRLAKEIIKVRLNSSPLDNVKASGLLTSKSCTSAIQDHVSIDPLV